jgi:hypothetical protein
LTIVKICFINKNLVYRNRNFNTKDYKKYPNE